MERAVYLASFPCSLKTLTPWEDPILTLSCCGGEAACKPQPRGHTEDRGSGPVVDHADSSVSWDLAHLRLLRVWRVGPVFVGAVPGRCGALLCVSGLGGCSWLTPGEMDHSNHSFLGKLLFCSVGR